MTISPNRRSEEEREAELIGGTIIPTIVVLVYGVYRLIKSGFDARAFPYPYLLIFGGLFSIFCTAAYATLGPSPVPNWTNSAKAFGGFVPFLFSLYVILCIGAWSILEMFWVGFTIGSLVFGVFWILVGYKMLYSFWELTEMRGSQQTTSN